MQTKGSSAVGNGDVFFVDGKALSIGNKLSFQDMEGNELVFIRQKLLAWGPTYELYRDGIVAAIVKKELFTFFACRFDVDGLESLTLEHLQLGRWTEIPIVELREATPAASGS